MPKQFMKDPDAKLDYKIDWTAWLASGETVSVSTWTVPSGITKDSDSITDAGASTTIWLSGGTVGTDYSLTNHITTSASREDDRTIKVGVVQK
jgi:hypothetical protein